MKRSLVTALLFLFAACSSQGTTVDQQRTFIFSGKQYPGEIAMVIPAEILDMKYKYEPGAILGSGGGFEIRFGKTVSDMLVSAAEYVYSEVTVLSAMPRSGQYERVLKITSKAAGLSNDFDHSRNSTSSSVTCNITLVVESFNGGDMKPLKSTNVVGTNTFRSTMSLNQSKGKLIDSLTDAVSQAAEKLANLLGKGFAEPPKV